MTIGYDASRAFSKNRTGTENYSYQILKHLAKIDTVNNYVVYVRPGSQVGHGWPPNFKFQIINFKFLWTQVGLALQTLINPPDVLFIPSHTLPLVRRPGLKTVLTVHDLGAQYLPQHHQLKQRLYLGLMTSYQINTATQIIAVSEATKTDLIKKIGVKSEKIKVIYEGIVDSAKHRLNRDALANVLRQYDIVSGNYFLFVGTIQPRKNLERLIRAYDKWLRSGSSYGEEVAPNQPLNRNPQPLLVLAGGKGWLSDEIYKLPKQLGIQDKVKFLGYVSDKDLPALYQGAISFTFPSLFEGFGLPVLEAMSQGVPVLTSNSSSLPEVAGDAAILVNPHSADEIEAGLVKLLNIDVRRSLIKKGYVQAKKFSWEKAARETLNILQEVAKKR